MKVLRICNSQDLPSYNNRNDNYIYFTYDNLNLYVGKSSQYAGLYAIVETLPEIGPIDKPVGEMFYITLDGDVNIYRNDAEDWTVIAQIESDDQKEYLEKAGTTFLLKSGHKYIDFQRKVLCLPYQNGEYQLSVNLDKPIMIDNQTIIVYNPETGRFEIDGGRYYDEFGRNPEIMKYTGVNTNSINTFIQNDHIHADVRISPKVGNMLRTRTDGLYVPEKEFASLEEFNALVARTQAEVTAYERYMQDVADAMQNVDITLTDQTLTDKIEDEMSEYIPQIQEIVDHFEEAIEHFHQLEEDLTLYINNTVNTLYTTTIERIEAIENAWGYFAPRFKATVERVSLNHYTITVDFPIESGYGLFYKPSMLYLYPEQDISDLSFTQFNNGDTLNIQNGSTVTLCYARIDGAHKYTDSCSYAKLEEETVSALITVNNDNMPVSIEECNNRWTWLDPNMLYKPGTFGMYSPVEHRIYFFVPPTEDLDVYNTTPNESNFEHFDYTNNQIVLNIYRNTNPSNGYYLAGIQMDPGETRVTGTFYGNSSGYINETMYGNTGRSIIYVSRNICVTNNGNKNSDLVIFAKE